MNKIVTLADSAGAAEQNLTTPESDRSVIVLREIESLEGYLRAMRSRIEEFHTRREQLVREVQHIDEAIEAEDINFALNLNAVVGAVAEAPASLPAETETSDLKNSPPVSAPTDKEPDLRKFHNWLKNMDRQNRERMPRPKSRS